MEDCFHHVKYNQNLIEFDQNCTFHEFSMDLNAPTSKIQNSASMSPNFLTNILLKSTSKCLLNDMFIIFFGYVVVKISIMEHCCSEYEIASKVDKFYENSIFHEFSMDLNASTLKIQISVTVSPNFVKEILL